MNLFQATDTIKKIAERHHVELEMVESNWHESVALYDVYKIKRKNKGAEYIIMQDFMGYGLYKLPVVKYKRVA